MVLGKLGPEQFLSQIGPRQIGSRQIGPRQIGPRQIGPPADWARKILGAANWAPENLLVANWAPANWAPADWAPWRQIGPRQFFSSSANWDLANRAPHPPPLPTPCMAKDNNFVKHYNVFTTMKKSFYVNYIYMLPKGLQNYTKFASEWKAFPYGSLTQIQTIFGHCPLGGGLNACQDGLGKLSSEMKCPREPV